MEHLLNQTITIYTFDKLNENGDKLYKNNVVTVNARVVVGDILVMQPTGENRVVKGKIQIMGDVLLQRNDKVVYKGYEFSVEKVHEKIDGSGNCLFMVGYLD